MEHFRIANEHSEHIVVFVSAGAHLKDMLTIYALLIRDLRECGGRRRSNEREKPNEDFIAYGLRTARRAFEPRR
jgi:hypothetical protein